MAALVSFGLNGVEAVVEKKTETVEIVIPAMKQPEAKKKK